MMASSFMDQIAALRETLDEQARAMRRIAETLATQRSALAAMRGADLEDAQQALAAPAEQMLELETKRRALHARIAASLGIEARELRVQTLASKLTEPMRSRLLQAAKGTREAAEALRLEAHVGERLLAWSASCHEQLLMRLVASRRDTSAYGPAGQIEQPADSLLVDTTR